MEAGLRAVSLKGRIEWLNPIPKDQSVETRGLYEGDSVELDVGAMRVRSACRQDSSLKPDLGPRRVFSYNLPRSTHV